MSDVCVPLVDALISTPCLIKYRQTGEWPNFGDADSVARALRSAPNSTGSFTISRQPAGAVSISDVI